MIASRVNLNLIILIFVSLLLWAGVNDDDYHFLGRDEKGGKMDVNNVDQGSISKTFFAPYALVPNFCASKKLLKKLGVVVGRKWIELSLWFAPNFYEIDPWMKKAVDDVDQVAKMSKKERKKAKRL